MSVITTASQEEERRRAGRMLACGIDLFSRLGFDDTTLNAIADAAEASVEEVQALAEDKAALWRLCVLDLAKTIASERSALAPAAEAAPLMRLRITLRAFIQASWRFPAWSRLVTLESLAGGWRLAWLNEHLIGPRNIILLNLIKETINAGRLKPYPPEQILVTLLAASTSAVNMAPLLRQLLAYDADTPEGREAHESLIMDALFAGLIIDSP
jgi:AcrR family transcriptional regulator